jgi:type III secretory pathway component EscU
MCFHAGKRQVDSPITAALHFIVDLILLILLILLVIILLFVFLILCIPVTLRVGRACTHV